MAAKLLGERSLCCLLATGLILTNPFANTPANQRRTQSSTKTESFDSLDDILSYISADWNRLSRSLDKCASYADAKVEDAPLLILPAGVEIPADLSGVRRKCSVQIDRLPAKLDLSGPAPEVPAHGLLYLPHPYVVPGGQFNEMYGWDSYFIIRGLLRDNREALARGMVENFFFEMDHYGGILNANRTYYLGRSQPPFLTSMILAVYEAAKPSGNADLAWLRKAYRYAVADYAQWTHPPHLAGATGLSRYYDEGDGPVPEIMGDPSNYYRGVARYFLLHEGESSPHLVRVDAEHPASSLLGPVFPVLPCSSSAEKADRDCKPEDRVGLAAEYYKGDRAMRESGFDVTFRFGPFGVNTHHFAPVCLNSLLYKTEMDLAGMSLLLGQPQVAAEWKEKARERHERIDKYLWNPGKGQFFDFDFVTQKQSDYEYATTFYPLWAGFASKDQARALEGNLARFEQPGGLAMSRFESQAQWDFPYGWAPIHLLALEGLRRYGYAIDADRLTREFLTMVLENFRRDHTIREKYNVVRRTSSFRIGVGYAQNVIGFGWTNAAFLELLHEAPPAIRAQVRDDARTP